MVDTKGGAVKGLSKVRDVVADNAIFREKVRKEKQFAQLNENFDFNPKNLICITEKPTRKFNVLEGKSDPQMEELKTKLGTLTSMPK